MAGSGRQHAGILQSISVLLAVVAIFLAQTCASEKAHHYSFVKEATEFASRRKYDYIIVGGGTAGCPLAATLSNKFRVLVLERGGVPYGNVNVTRLEGYTRTLADNRADSPAQRFVSTDGVISARARILGGGSCLNAGFYSRASPAYVRRVGWNASLVNESYPWVEKIVAHMPDVQQWQSAVRNGLLEVGVTPYNGETFDHLLGTKVGGSIFDRKGNRHTAADLLEYAHPKQITVLLHATVHRILFQTGGKPRPSAYAVLYTDARGRMHRASLDRSTKGSEIIITAGALGSPQLLMLSGIGPAEHLRTFNISVVLDLPGVGAGMADNPMNAIFVPSPLPVEISLIEVVGVTEFGSFIEAASGMVPSIGSGGFTMDLGLMSPQIGQLATFPPGQRTDENIAAAVDQLKAVAAEQGGIWGGFILEKVIGPLSNGKLRLLTTNVSDNPSVTFNYFSEPADLERCVEGIRTIERVIQSGSFTDFKFKNESTAELRAMTGRLPVNVIPKHTNDSSSLGQFCRDSVTTIWHYHGGCQVGRVVDPDYHVLGVDALRVIDGSTWNFSPGTNPQATVMMLGRYMGVQIIRERHRREEDA